MKTRKPRRSFRSRPAVTAAVADRLGGRLNSGTLVHVDIYCQMPKGGPCRCRAVDVELAEPIDRARN